MKNTLDIDAVGLDPPRPAVDLQAGRLHHQTRDAALLKQPSQPEAVVAGLVAQRHRRCLTHDPGYPVPRRVELGQQAFNVAALDRMQARIVPTRSLDRQEPAVLAQLKSCMECGFNCGNCCRPGHGVSLLLIDVETIEGA